MNYHYVTSFREVCLFTNLAVLLKVTIYKLVSRKILAI